MRKLFACLLLLVGSVAQAQFVPGQLLTAAALNAQFSLYAPLAGATFTGPVTIPSLTTTAASLGGSSTATTQGFLDNSTLVATDQFAKRSILASSATLPINVNSGGQGTYNFATVGSGTQIVVFVSSGTISSVLTIAVPGSGYQVGDCLIMVGGNGDAILRVTSVSGGGVTGASVVYGGTGYTTGAQLSGMPLPPGSRTGAITGTLTSNMTIIIPAGTYLQGGRRIGFQNNTTGAFTISVFLSNGSGGSTGTGTTLPQGSANSTSTLLYTDGQNDVWPEVSLSGIGAAPLNSPSFTGIPTSPTASATTNTTQIATTAMVNSAITGGSLAGSFSTLTTSGQNQFTNTSAGAAIIRMTGNGATTPNKYLGVLSGLFTIYNSSGGGLLASVDDSGNLITTGSITPSSTGGVVGTTTNNNANAGSVGEYQTTSNSASAISSATTTNITSISLTAGDWDVQGLISYVPTATISNAFSAISTTSGSLGALGNYTTLPGSSVTGSSLVSPTPTVRVSISATTTVYLVGNVSFPSGTCTAQGFIRARRVR